MGKLIRYIIFAVLLGNTANAQGIGFGENPHLDALFATLQTDDGQEAESEIMLIFRQSGSDAMDLILARGFNAMSAGQLADSVWHFSALVDHAPDFAEGYAGRAFAFYNLGELALAVKDVHKALSLNPRHFVALSGLGFVQEELGHLDEALLAYRLAFSLNPHFDGLSEAIERVESQLTVLH